MNSSCLLHSVAYALLTLDLPLYGEIQHVVGTLHTQHFVIIMYTLVVPFIILCHSHNNSSCSHTATAAANLL